MDTFILSVIIVSLCCLFFFSGIEIAFLSSNKLQLELEAKQGSAPSKIMLYLLKKPAWFIGTTLTGNILASVFFGYGMMLWLSPHLEPMLPAGLYHGFVFVLIQTFLSTTTILFTAEFLPKSLFMFNPNTVLRTLAIPFSIAFGFLFPFMLAITLLAKIIIVYVLRLDYSEEKPAFGLTDLSIYLQNMPVIKHENEDIDLDKKIFRNALEFKTVRIWDCMIPRTEIVALPVTEDIQKLRETFVESGHSKIVIYSDTIDNVIGYCHSSALFKQPHKIEEILTSIIIVPETMLANELMIKFINERKSLAVVIDEFGGTSGLVSMEDVIEEIFGEIEDEHDEDDLIEQKIDEQNYLLSGRLEINYLNEKYGWNLPVGDYGTLAGLILSHTENLPRQGETIDATPYTFTVQNTRDNRIDTVKMRIDKVES